ncbi:unnamed protein product [Amoebophrya sp. A120]|nr:unnamed protein product [Amoebophrya sp. A120]|eukprot:GSA120T00025560001.1
MLARTTSAGDPSTAKPSSSDLKSPIVFRDRNLTSVHYITNDTVNHFVQTQGKQFSLFKFGDPASVEYYAEQLVAKIRERFGKRIEAILKVDSSSSLSSGSSCCNASHQELPAGGAVVFPASAGRTQELQGLSYASSATSAASASSASSSSNSSCEELVDQEMPDVADNFCHQQGSPQNSKVVSFQAAFANSMQKSEFQHPEQTTTSTQQLLLHNNNAPLDIDSPVLLKKRKSTDNSLLEPQHRGEDINPVAHVGPLGTEFLSGANGEQDQNGVAEGVVPPLHLEGGRAANNNAKTLNFQQIPSNKPTPTKKKSVRLLIEQLDSADWDDGTPKVSERCILLATKTENHQSPSQLVDLSASPCLDSSVKVKKKYPRTPANVLKLADTKCNLMAGGCSTSSRVATSSASTSGYVMPGTTDYIMADEDDENTPRPAEHKMNQMGRDFCENNNTLQPPLRAMNSSSSMLNDHYNTDSTSLSSSFFPPALAGASSGATSSVVLSSGSQVSASLKRSSRTVNKPSPSSDDQQKTAGLYPGTSSSVDGNVMKQVPPPLLMITSYTNNDITSLTSGGIGLEPAATMNSTSDVVEVLDSTTGIEQLHKEKKEQNKTTTPVALPPKKKRPRTLKRASTEFFCADPSAALGAVGGTATASTSSRMHPGVSCGSNDMQVMDTVVEETADEQAAMLFSSSTASTTTAAASASSSAAFSSSFQASDRTIDGSFGFQEATGQSVSFSSTYCSAGNFLLAPAASGTSTVEDPQSITSSWTTSHAAFLPATDHDAMSVHTTQQDTNLEPTPTAKNNPPTTSEVLPGRFFPDLVHDLDEVDASDKNAANVGDDQQEVEEQDQHEFTSPDLLEAEPPDEKIVIVAVSSATSIPKASQLLLEQVCKKLNLPAGYMRTFNETELFLMQNRRKNRRSSSNSSSRSRSRSEHGRVVASSVGGPPQNDPTTPVPGTIAAVGAGGSSSSSSSKSKSCPVVYANCNSLKERLQLIEQMRLEYDDDTCPKIGPGTECVIFIDDVLASGATYMRTQEALIIRRGLKPENLHAAVLVNLAVEEGTGSANGENAGHDKPSSFNLEGSFNHLSLNVDSPTHILVEILKRQTEGKPVWKMLTFLLNSLPDKNYSKLCAYLNNRNSRTSTKIKHWLIDATIESGLQKVYESRFHLLRGTNDEDQFLENVNNATGVAAAAVGENFEIGKNGGKKNHVGLKSGSGRFGIGNKQLKRTTTVG